MVFRGRMRFELTPMAAVHLPGYSGMYGKGKKHLRLFVANGKKGQPLQFHVLRNI
jgi:hypothetical protein